MSPTGDFETVRNIAMALPEVQESLGARGWAFKVRGKLLACKAINRSAEAGTLAVRIAFADRARLIAADPKVFYVTAHYENYPMILVRVARISHEALADLLEKSWQFVTAESSAARGGKSAGRAKSPRAAAKRSSRRFSKPKSR